VSLESWIISAASCVPIAFVGFWICVLVIEWIDSRPRRTLSPFERAIRASWQIEQITQDARQEMWDIAEDDRRQTINR
jgi:hypothetical protein